MKLRRISYRIAAAPQLLYLCRFEPVLSGLAGATRSARRFDHQERKTWYPRAPYYAILLIAVAVCGFALGKSPNPMEGAVKIFKGMVGLQPSIMAVVLAFVFFVGLAIIGNKLVCGWACPFGALQELIYSLPILRRVKCKKVPFVVSNLIRGGLFVLMLLLLFGVVGGKRGFVVYHFINPFNLFNLLLRDADDSVDGDSGPRIVADHVSALLPVHLPVWVRLLAGRTIFSLVRVRVNHDRCNGCVPAQWPARCLRPRTWWMARFSRPTVASSPAAGESARRAITYQGVWSSSNGKPRKQVAAPAKESQPAGTAD